MSQSMGARVWDRLRRFVRGRQAVPREILIVRRGLSDAYYEFLDIFARANRAMIIVDRRLYDRRHPDSSRSRLERRVVERRQPAPATWELGDVVVFRNRMDGR